MPVPGYILRMMRPLAQRVVGEVATNTMDPFGYDVGIDRFRVGDARDPGVRPGQDLDFQESWDARNYLFRRMFNLSPREGREQFIETGPRSVKFAPGLLLSRITTPSPAKTASGAPWHPVLGQYKRRWKGDDTLHYYDRWDFDLNPGEWRDLDASSPINLVLNNDPATLARILVAPFTDPVTVTDDVKMEKFWKGIEDRLAKEEKWRRVK